MSSPDATIASSSELGARARDLASEVTRRLAESDVEALPPDAVQALMAAACRAYSAQSEAGNVYAILSDRDALTSTDVMVTCAALLKAADLQVFELGMWSSWTGR